MLADNVFRVSDKGGGTEYSSNIDIDRDDSVHGIFRFDFGSDRLAVHSGDRGAKDNSLFNDVELGGGNNMHNDIPADKEDVTE